MTQQEKTEILTQIDEMIKRKEESAELFEKGHMPALKSAMLYMADAYKQVRQLIESKEVTE